MFRQTDQGDLYRPAGASTFERVSGAQECVQHLRQRLRLVAGEVFRDTRVGVDMRILLNPGFSPNAIATHLASVALGTPGVVDCDLAYSFEPVRSIVTIDMNAVFLLEDQRTRVPLHENFTIAVGGSIQT